MHFSLNTSLQYQGFKGEGIVKERCWINKTHFPFRAPFDREYESQVIILAVRNPLDVINSFFNMIATQSHTLSHDNDVDDPNISPYWEMFFQTDVDMWFEWHQYWMEKIKTSDIPIYFFRFEDLLL